LVRVFYFLSSDSDLKQEKGIFFSVKSFNFWVFWFTGAVAPPPKAGRHGGPPPGSGFLFDIHEEQEQVREMREPCERERKREWEREKRRENERKTDGGGGFVPLFPQLLFTPPSATRAPSVFL
jgi:hypothetical protein